MELMKLNEEITHTEEKVALDDTRSETAVSLSSAFESRKNSFFFE